MTATTLEPDTTPPFYRIRQERVWIQIHKNDRRALAEAILDGLSVWAETAITSSTEVMRTTVSITPRGKVRISKPFPGGQRERWLIIEPTDAVDLAEELLAAE
ncbi:hypothetical protein [Mycolicibacterium farcinogenes]|uniref:Uncharacterized protein n=1 Tax=Mycolicibacterium farcinogenes TaxID=1802 RepID=A0ACD1F9T4_MYCFR|nr:hypothetical protein [Mycolicibacterium farcinogenes]QZH63811.1 hypothetical protein K6L26_17165 [Mycolicibacterium farcinogenes]